MKRNMVFLILIFLVSSVLTNLFFFRDIGKISIDSNLYQTIKVSKDLKADMLPPRLYIVESYLFIQQLASEQEASDQERLLQKVDDTRRAYSDSYRHWGDKVQDESLSVLIQSSNQFVESFYRTYDQLFLPALREGDYEKLSSLANADLKELFESHRALVDQMSLILEESSDKTERDASDFADRTRMLLLGIYVLSTILILIVSMILFRKATQVEANLITAKRETDSTNERLEAIVQGLKVYKHSFDNTIASIEGYVLRKDLLGLGSYLEEMVGEKNKEMTNYIKLDFIRNPAVTGLVLSKMLYAERLNVTFTLKVRQEIEELPFPVNQLCELLGILLDNALEASLDSPDPKVSFLIGGSEEALHFEIVNSITTPPDQANMYEKGWSTKGENRGYGLFVVRDILSKEDHLLLNTSVEEGLFKQELIVLSQIAEPDDSGTLFTDVL